MYSLVFALFFAPAIVLASQSGVCSTGERQVIIENNCNYNIWVGGWWSQIGTDSEGGTGYLLPPGRNNYTCIPEPFNGRFWARTGCNFESDGLCANNAPCCESGNCITADNKFGLLCGKPGVPPVTIAEFNMLSWGVPPYQDYYDVSQVDGANVPMQIVPITNTFTSDESNPYWCGTPGCTDATCQKNFTLPSCSWTYSAGNLSRHLQMIVPRACSSDSDCENSVCDTHSRTCICEDSSDCGEFEECGAAMIPGVGLKYACGHNSGWYGAGGVCALNGNLGEPLNCNETIPGQGTRTNLYQCNGANRLSCASNGAQETCCGCPPWEPEGTCINKNPQWEKHAQPFAQIFKDACPTSYSFPYDDMSSTFICRGTDVENLVGYEITFCPSGSPNSL